MRAKFIFVMAALLPLFVVVILAIIGIILNLWVYIVLGMVCPLVAGVVCFIYKDMERKITSAKEGLKNGEN